MRADWGGTVGTAPCLSHAAKAAELRVRSARSAAEIPHHRTPTISATSRAAGTPGPSMSARLFAGSGMGLMG